MSLGRAAGILHAGERCRQHGLAQGGRVRFDIQKVVFDLKGEPDGPAVLAQRLDAPRRRVGRGDIGFNLVWQSGIYLTRTEYVDRTVYDLTTDLTSPNAELIQGVGNGGTSKGVFCVPLRLTVTQLK